MATGDLLYYFSNISPTALQVTIYQLVTVIAGMRKNKKKKTTESLKNYLGLRRLPCYNNIVVAHIQFSSDFALSLFGSLAKRLKYVCRCFV